jgi:hypothetical protein
VCENPNPHPTVRIELVNWQQPPGSVQTKNEAPSRREKEREDEVPTRDRTGGQNFETLDRDVANEWSIGNRLIVG